MTNYIKSNIDKHAEVSEWAKLDNELKNKPPFKIQLENLPDELTSSGNWYGYVLIGKKKIIVPRDDNEKPIKKAFEIAATARELQGWTGLVRDLEPDIVCIDIDRFGEWNQNDCDELIDFIGPFFLAGAYCEWTRGGIHIWGRANKLDIKKKDKDFYGGRVEVFTVNDVGITVTGHIFADRGGKGWKLPDLTEAIKKQCAPLITQEKARITQEKARHGVSRTKGYATTVHGSSTLSIPVETILAKARGEHPGFKPEPYIQRLLDSGYQGDYSCDDIRLLNRLFKFTRDEQQIREIWTNNPHMLRQRDEQVASGKYNVNRLQDEKYIAMQIEDCRKFVSELKQPKPKAKQPPSVAVKKNKLNAQSVKSNIERKPKALPASTSGPIVIGEQPAPIDITRTDPFGVSEIDILKPHGILGNIASAIDDMARRPAPLLYIPGALHMLNLSGGRNMGLYGNRTGLMTVGIAETGAGKGTIIAAIDDMLDRVCSGKQHLVSPVSNIEVKKSAFYENGSPFYLIDEGGQLVTAICNKNAPAYIQNIISEMILLSTSNKYTLGPKHKREMLLEVNAEIKDLTKDIEEASLEDRAYLQGMLAQLLESKNQITNGIESPVLNVLMLIQNEVFDRIGNAENINNGHFGRNLIFRDGGYIPSRHRRQPKKKLSNGIIKDLQRIRHKHLNETLPVRFADGVEDLFEDIDIFYDRFEFNNHPERGKLYRRMMEKVITVASILAFESGQVTEQDLKYALAVALQDVKEVDYLRWKNEFDNPDIQDIAERIRREVKTREAKGQPTTPGKVKNAVLKSNSAARRSEALCQGKKKQVSLYDLTLNFLIGRGQLRESEGRLTSK